MCQGEQSEAVEIVYTVLSYCFNTGHFFKASENLDYLPLGCAL